MELVNFLLKIVLVFQNFLLKLDFSFQFMLLLLHLIPYLIGVIINVLSCILPLKELVAKAVDFFLQGIEGSLIIVKVSFQI